MLLIIHSPLPRQITLAGENQPTNLGNPSLETLSFSLRRPRLPRSLRTPPAPVAPVQAAVAVVEGAVEVLGRHGLGPSGGEDDLRRSGG